MILNKDELDIIDCPIYIRPIEYYDTDNIVKWRNSEDVKKNFIYQGVFTKESHENWMRTMVETGKVVQMIICDSLTDAPIGSVYVRDIDEEKSNGEYGIFIGQADARGKGYGNIAARLMVNYAKNVIGLKKLFLRAFEDNTAAIKSYENVGFIRNGKTEDIEINGNVRKVIFMENNLV